MKKITIVFRHKKGFHSGNHEKEFELEDESTEEEIGEAFNEWVWEQIGDKFT
nr:hypothetical protein [Brevibacillus laterosporus]